MRTRRRIGLLLASAAALGVGLIAFPASSAAAPPPVTSCVPKPSTGSDSCVTLQVGQATGVGPIGAAFENAKLGVRTRSTFSPASSETTSVVLRFDDDLKVNLGAVAGTCTASSLTGDTIQQAWNQCGPGPGGSNTYLSTGLGAQVSGVASTVIAGIDACTMAFKGANVNQIILYARAPIGNPSTECNSPATNTGGTTTVLLTGTLSTLPAASPYGPQLTVPNTHVPNPSLDDFNATITRGTAFQAKCPAGQSPHKLQGVFDYTAAGDANDTISPPYAGTSEACNDVTPY
jgi:hypothetical protein